VAEGAIDFGLRNFRIWAGEDACRFSLGDFEQVAITNDVRDLEAG
jgi:hypothetical protein